MNTISLSLPEGSSVTGEILRDYSYSPERLSGDILQIELPTGVVIDVGFSPRFDLSGTFQIVLIKDDNWDEPLVGPIESNDPAAVASLVQELAARHGQLLATRSVM